MGLDMYVVEVCRPELYQKYYTARQLRELGYSYRTVKQFEEDSGALGELLPYCSKAWVAQSDFDMKKIKSDFNLPEDSHIGMWTAEKVIVTGRRGDESVRQEISRRDIEEKYTIVTREECYIWHSNQVAYWRKDYEKQDVWHEILDRNIENCGYYELAEGDIDMFLEAFPDDENSFLRQHNDSGLFYHEWY